MQYSCYFSKGKRFALFFRVTFNFLFKNIFDINIIDLIWSFVQFNYLNAIMQFVYNNLNKSIYLYMIKICHFVCNINVIVCILCMISANPLTNTCLSRKIDWIKSTVPPIRVVVMWCYWFISQPALMIKIVSVFNALHWGTGGKK